MTLRLCLLPVVTAAVAVVPVAGVLVTSAPAAAALDGASGSAGASASASASASAGVAAGQRCAQPGPPFRGTPWQQQMLAPERVAPFADGSGVVVAVLSTGVDAAQPQLAGRVAAGFDAVAGHGTADDDCLGEGTRVAGVIAARADSLPGTVDVAGLASGARILPVRVVGGDVSQNSDQKTDPKVLAAGIGWAVSQGAGVIDVADPADRDSPELRAAVADALAHRVVVISAAGDLTGEATADPAAGPGTPPTPSPASYDGVLAVGAVDRSGRRGQDSPSADFVRLVAPGVAVACLQRGGGVSLADGTGIASGFVAATAALVRERMPDASAATVVRQLTATATPLSGPGSGEYGHGLVNPYSAVTTQPVSARPASVPPVVRTTRTPPRESASAASSNRLSFVLAAVGVTTTCALLFAAVVIPRGRRAGWRPSNAAVSLVWEGPAEPGPPLPLFEEHEQDQNPTIPPRM